MSDAQTVDLAISRALLDISKNHPEYDPLISRICLVEIKEEGTTAYMSPACKLGYNVKFFSKLKPSELDAVVMHEVLHYVYGHFSRAKHLELVQGRLHHEVANIAMDVEINQRIEGLPSLVATAAKFNLKEGLTFEEYYVDLLKNAKVCSMSSSAYMQGDVKSDSQKGKGGQGKGQDGKDGKDKNPGSGSGKEGEENKSSGSGQDEGPSEEQVMAEAAEVEAQQQVLDEIDKAADELGRAGIGYGHGNGRYKAKVKYVPPVNLSRYIRSVYQNLSDELSYGFDVYDYNKLKETMIPDVLTFPQRECKPEIKVAVILDTSGSRSNEQVSHSLSKLYSTVLNLDADAYTFDLFEVDSQVAKVTKIKSPSDIPHEFNGGGGTCMYVAYKSFKVKYDLVIILTDGELFWNDEIKNVPKIYEKKIVIGVDSYNYGPTKENSPFPVFVQ